MYVRIVCVRGKKYMQVVHSYREGGQVKQRVLIPLGRYEKEKFEAVRTAVRDWEVLERAQEVIDELQNSGGRIQGKSYFLKFRGWK
jgi:geranylgeranyl pyrophosphate synthase